jgi:hypothetical protein
MLFCRGANTKELKLVSGKRFHSNDLLIGFIAGHRIATLKMHSSLGRGTPDEIYFKQPLLAAARWCLRRSFRRARQIVSPGMRLLVSPNEAPMGFYPDASCRSGRGGAALFPGLALCRPVGCKATWLVMKLRQVGARGFDYRWVIATQFVKKHSAKNGKDHAYCAGKSGQCQSSATGTPYRWKAETAWLSIPY